MIGSQLTAEDMEAVMRKYYDGCNTADASKMVACFTPEAVHYLAPGVYDEPRRIRHRPGSFRLSSN